jgi:glutathione peroxidase
LGIPCNQFAGQEPGTPDEIEWNFENFLVAPSGEVLARFRPTLAPEDERIVEQIERALR